MNDAPIEVSPVELKSILDAGQQVRLIDCRESYEHAICRIEGAELIPMRLIPQYLPDLALEARPVVVYCHHGVRSLSVVDWLRRQGVVNCQSMAGGIDLWTTLVDPAVPRY